jgi:hypothetical protein
VLGVGATPGRTFAASEDDAGNDSEVVLSKRIWRSRFGGDPEVIGRKITLDANSYTIIGVLPANSTFDQTWAAMWLPLSFTPANMTPGASLLIRSFNRLRSLDPGVDTTTVLAMDLPTPPTRFANGTALTNYLNGGDSEGQKRARSAGCRHHG